MTNKYVTNRGATRFCRPQATRLITLAEQKLRRNEKQQSVDADDAYWLAATRLEALLGMGKSEPLEKESKRIHATAPAAWMPDSTREQLDKLKYPV